MMCRAWRQTLPSTKYSRKYSQVLLFSARYRRSRRCCQLTLHIFIFWFCWLFKCLEREKEYSKRSEWSFLCEIQQWHYLLLVEKRTKFRARDALLGIPAGWVGEASHHNLLLPSERYWLLSLSLLNFWYQITKDSSIGLKAFTGWAQFLPREPFYFCFLHIQVIQMQQR